MRQLTKRRHRVPQLFSIFISMTIVVWLLRGFGIITFVPGGIVWLLIILSISTGIFSRLQSRWRRF